MKIIVAHPGKQHSFRVATALKKQGLLYKYATTVYDKESSFLMKIIKSFLGKDNLNRANNRKCKVLNDEDVIQFCEVEGLLLLALLRLDKSKKISNWLMNRISVRFQNKLANYIIKQKIDLVISYDTNSSILFSILDKKAPNVIKIMDNAHPNRHYLHYSYNLNWDCCGPFSESLKMEYKGFLINEEYSKTFGEEIKKADYHIVASTYSEKALEFDNIKNENIYKIPYGVDKNRFIKPDRSYNNDFFLNVLFIGEVNQRKGIAQILKAAQIINHKKMVFTIIGKGLEHCSYLYEPYKEYVNFFGRVAFDELLAHLSKNHIFVFPTMGEGFGLVLLEAMAAGLPVIATPNCGAIDIVKDGFNGFLIPVGDHVSLIEKLEWCQTHPLELSKMSTNAISTAKEYTWERYEKSICDMVTSLC